MYKNQFDKDTNIYDAYMFYGQCDYLIEQYALKTAKQLASGDDIQKIYFDEYKFKDCSNFLAQSSLFSASNILFIKTAKKIPKKDVDALIALCKTNPDSYVIFCCVGETDFKTMSKSFTKKNNSCEVVFYQPFDNEAIQILNNISQEKNIQIDINALQYLYSMHQKDLSLCVNDLNKLAILNKPIDISTINSQCFGMGSVNLDQFFLNLFSGKNINNDLYTLLEEGMNEIALVTQTTTFIQQLFNINTYLKLFGDLNIREIWGYNLPKPIAQSRANIAIKYSTNQISDMLNFFLTLELELKTKTTLDQNSYTQASFRKFSATLR